MCTRSKDTRGQMEHQDNKNLEMSPMEMKPGPSNRETNPLDDAVGKLLQGDIPL